MGINFVVKTKFESPACPLEMPELGKGVICPTVWVYGSYGVQIAKGYVYGRIDVYRSMKSRIDSMKVTGVWDFAKSNGVLRVGISGIGTQLVKSGIAVSNNVVFGADTPLVVYNGAVGVKVVHNYVHTYGFAGIRCGADVRNQGDCMLGFIGYNYVYSRLRNMTGAADSAGIYYCTHWFNPGNRARCNYVKGGDHCYYLDYNTSGVKVLGGVCYDNWDGLKVNNGKYNYLKHVLVVNALKAPGWCTCLTPTVNNCNKFPGNYWENMRLKYYNTPTFNTRWPWFTTVCNTTHVNGVYCNMKGNISNPYLPWETGKCSGLATNNYLDIIIVNGSNKPMEYRYCERSPAMPLLNQHYFVNVTLQDVPKLQFKNWRAGNFEVPKTSLIYKRRPRFINCKQQQYGPRKVDNSFYMKNFNIPKPVWMDALLAMRTLHIHDSVGWP
ncbi:hypothetical protein CLOM_g3968 [Closterium sp. NIES-68]|nr:hypothetical protein CLOM_g3968 [Closterium sp. NIES-68]GJP78102.1 hypothetical protein CLOP_g8428 [Closterium sp. NIES-67]